MDWFRHLFSTRGFVPRAQCGTWDQFTIWLHNIGDLGTWAAYMIIPLVLVRNVNKRHAHIPGWSRVGRWFAAFIIACGFTHLIAFVVFYYPMYRLSGVVKMSTAVISWCAILVTYRFLMEFVPPNKPMD